MSQGNTEGEIRQVDQGRGRKLLNGLSRVFRFGHKNVVPAEAVVTESPKVLELTDVPVEQKLPDESKLIENVSAEAVGKIEPLFVPGVSATQEGSVTEEPEGQEGSSLPDREELVVEPVMVAPVPEPEWVRLDVPINLTVGEEIDQGGQGIIYRAILATAGHPEGVAVVVKRAHYDSPDSKRFTPEQNRQRRQEGLKEHEESLVKEGQLIDQMRSRQAELFPDSPSHLPFSRLSAYTNKDEEQKPQLIMELLKKVNIYYGETFEGKPGHLKSALIQNLEAVAVAHSIGITNNDKGGELWYIPEDNRVVITDWGVPTEFTNAKVRTDLSMVVRRLSEDIMASYWPPRTLAKLRLLQTRLRSPRDTTSAMETIDLVKRIETAADEELSTPNQAHLSQEEERNATLIETVGEDNYELLRVWETMLRSGGCYKLSDNPRLKEELAKVEVEGRRSAITDFARFWSDFGEFKYAPSQIESGFQNKYLNGWNKELCNDAFTYFTAKDKTDEQTKDRLRAKIGTILSDNEIRSGYFDQGRTPIPQALLELI